jgi:hypothetical protein
MLRDFVTLVVSYRKTTLRVVSVENYSEALDLCLAATICYLGKGLKQICSFSEHADSRSISATFKQVTILVAKDHAFVYLWQSLVNVGHIRSRLGELHRL